MKKHLALPATFAALLLLGACTSMTGNTPGSGTSSSSAQGDTDDGTVNNAMPAGDGLDVPEMVVTDETVSSAPAGESRIIEMSVTDWAFAPNSITLKKGEKVTIRLTNTEGEHSFTSADLGINVPINKGETQDIVIPTGTAGTFSFRCAIPCGEGHKDMKGTIVIE